ncbi:MAG: isocitrate lyase/PEP mutase family protein [Alphaproteobacteria bacterium]|jgi:2-methylisocitrate lyase-like PEP mutase family enzyme|nr:isocitrate lyase/PEP mutase family protein [Alphaproteobacteria bacterium]
MTARDKRRALRARFDSGGLVIAPGVFDGISARVADGEGFDALYMTGYGVSASYLGMADAGFATLTEMVDRVRHLVDVTKTPLIADADTGYGGALNVRHTVRHYEAAGAAGLQLEDQEFPKKCGHTLGRKVIPLEDMVTKIKVAVDSREDDNTLIVARTDARTTHGLDEALRRAEAFQAAGADVLFVESPESEDEMARICARFDAPCLANMVEGGRTPMLPAPRLAELGYRIAIYPATGFLAVGAALGSVYATLKATGGSAGVEAPMTPFADFNTLVGFEDVWAFDEKYGTNDD